MTTIESDKIKVELIAPDKVRITNTFSKKYITVEINCGRLLVKPEGCSLTIGLPSTLWEL